MWPPYVPHGLPLCLLSLKHHTEALSSLASLSLRMACCRLSSWLEEDPQSRVTRQALFGRPTFDGHVDTLADGELGLDEDTAQVLPLIHALLHISQLEGSVLKYHLAVVVRQQQRVLVPLDGVVGVADDPAVNKGVPPGDSGDVPHCTDAGGAWAGVRREEEERRGEQCG